MRQIVGLLVASLWCAPFAMAQTEVYQAVLEGFDVSANSFCSSNNRLDLASFEPRVPGPVTFSRTCGANVTTLTLNVTAVAVIGGGTALPNRQYEFTDPIRVGATLTNVYQYPNANGSFNSIGISFADTTDFSVTPRGTCPDGVFRNQVFQGSATVTISLPDCARNPRQSTSRDGEVDRFRIWTHAHSGPSPGAGNNGLLPQVNVEVYARYRVERVVARDLGIDHIHPVQSVGIPAFGHYEDVPLVQGKYTIIRVFVVSFLPGAISNVKGTATANGVPLTAVPRPPYDPIVVATDRLNRSNRGASLDFYVPEEETRNGGITVSATVWYETSPGIKGPDARPANNTLSLTRTLEPTKWPSSFRIGYVPVCLRGPTGLACPAIKPRSIGLYLSQYMPAARTMVIPVPMPRLTINADFSTTPDGAAQGTLAMIQSYFEALTLNPTDEVIHQVTFVLPQASISAREDADTFFGEPGGLGGFWWVRDQEGDPAKMAHAIGHGIGHNAGLDHTNNADLNFNLVTGWNNLLDFPVNVNNIGIMEQGQSYGWIRADEFVRLHQLGMKESPAGVVRAAGGTAETLVISGQVARDGLTGSLNPGFHSVSSTAIAPSKAGSDLCLRYTVTGASFPDFCFDALPLGTGTQAYFAVAAPYPTGTTRVALRKGSVELAALATGAPPQVAIVAPQPGVSWTGTRMIGWTASGSNLVFRIEYSSDGGTTWQYLTGGLTGREYEVDTTQIIGGSNVRFRVVAASGLDNVAAVSGVIQVPQTVQLTVPVSTLDYRNLVVGEAEAKDFEITNSGTGRLQVTVTLPASAAFTLESAARLQLGPGQTEGVRVRFNPTVVGPQTVALRINDKTVTLRGAAFTSPTASITLGTETLDFGHAEVGKSKDIALDVVNAGGAALTLNSATVTAGFSIVTALPATIAAGERFNLVVRMAAATAGVRTGQLTIGSTDPSRAQLQVPVTATGVTGAVPLATAAGVLNAASFKGGAVSPGEIITIFGTAIGPPALAGIQLDAAGKVATQVGQTRVLFDGVPAPMVYALAGQTSVIVPYSVAANPWTDMVVEYQGRRSDPVRLLVARTAPALFSANSSGTGPGAILNQDFSVNSAARPALKGEVVQLFGTGEGSTNPAGVDGALAVGVFPAPLAGVTVTIGGLPAKVLYAGAAPGLVLGVIQVNVEVPAAVGAGNQAVVMTIGGVASQSGLTVAVGNSQ